MKILLVPNIKLFSIHFHNENMNLTYIFNKICMANRLVLYMKKLYLKIYFKNLTYEKHKRK